MNKKLTITIVTTVLNEEANIAFFLNDLLQQKLPDFSLEKILVVSDGSTDNTVKLAREIKDKRIEVVDHKGRKGKNARLNEVFKTLKTDIVVLLDADIRVKNPTSIHELVLPYKNNSNIALTSGIAIPFDPVTFSEHIAWISNALWKNILDHTKNTDMYRCEGKIRSMHRRLYSVLKFPLASAEDVYPYLTSKKMKLGFKYCKNASVQYQLPITWQDYSKQTVRFLQSKDIQSQYFDPEELEKGYVVGVKDKVLGLIRFLPQHPIWTSLYTLSLAVPKLIALLPYDDKHGKWDIVTSTKKLRGTAS